MHVVEVHAVPGRGTVVLVDDALRGLHHVRVATVPLDRPSVERLGRTQPAESAGPRAVLIYHRGPLDLHRGDTLVVAPVVGRHTATDSQLRLTAARAASSVARMPAGWGAPHDHDALVRELRREIVAHHRLAGVQVDAIAQSFASDDVLFATDLAAQPYAAVHLTYAVETTPDWPSTTLFACWSAWLDDVGA